MNRRRPTPARCVNIVSLVPLGPPPLASLLMEDGKKRLREPAAVAALFMLLR